MNLNKERMPSRGAYGSRWHGFQVNLLHGLNDLCDKFLTKDSSVIELGCNLGISTRIFCSYAKKVTAVDIIASESILKLEKEFKNLNFIHSNNTEYLNKCFNHKSLYDMVYIDADHSYSSVKEDIYNASKVLKKGGIMSGHDMLTDSENGVLRAVTEFNPKITTGEAVLHRFSDSSWAFLYEPDNENI